MPRRSRGSGDEQGDLDLVPFMNMVVVLIPMLLLSVVFLKIGVINITSPKLSVGPPSEKKPEKKEKPLNLTVAVDDKGFRIGATGAILPPQQGCPKTGPTICLAEDSVNVQEEVKQAREAFAKGKGGAVQGRKILKKTEGAYNWMGLYNQLMKIKSKYPDETVVKVSASPDMPYSLVIRTMDVARYKLEEDSYDSRKKFWQAKPETEVKGEKKIPKALFNDPVLSIAK